jgi:hypothetical protein
LAIVASPYQKFHNLLIGTHDGRFLAFYRSLLTLPPGLICFFVVPQSASLLFRICANLRNLWILLLLFLGFELSAFRPLLLLLSAVSAGSAVSKSDVVAVVASSLRDLGGQCRFCCCGSRWHVLFAPCLTLPPTYPILFA